MSKWTRLVGAAAMAALCVTRVVRADPAPFDLAGPILEVKVTRGTVSLPIAEVPNLAAGDHLWVRADLPASQSAPYLLVVAFLRGSTNPPPPSWFQKCDTSERKCADAGLSVIVPDDARQVLLFLAPRTGGDFKTLVNAVRGRPGAFVRASQDLNQATLDRGRLERYLAAVRALNDADPRRLKDAAPLLARSLAIKVDEKCLTRLPELQAPCLMDAQNSLILDDGHSTSIVQALTSGAAGDLAMEASYTPQLSYGYYSPYIASIFDIARILDSFHTAKYQYLPALGRPEGDRLRLTLNTPPSFYDPKSVLVTALPAVEQAQLPPLHAVDPQGLYCTRKSALVLPVEGAPLVFSTRYAHDMALRVTRADGVDVDLPATANAEQGGFVIDTSAFEPAAAGGRIRASLHGYWGFDRYEGPAFELVNSHPQSWRLASGDSGALIVGREDVVHLTAAEVSCVDGFMLRDPAGKELKVDWKPVHPDEVELKLPLQQAAPGALTLLVSESGQHEPQAIALTAFTEAAHLDALDLHAGDDHGELRGSRLDEVASVSVKGIAFTPGVLEASQGTDRLELSAQDPQVARVFRSGESVTVKVTLKDGRSLSLRAAIGAPRPRVSLLAANVQPSAANLATKIDLLDSGLLPQGATLTFSVRAEQPASFGGDLAIEVATADGSFSARLDSANGGLLLENAAVAVATLDPARAFGQGAFGALRFRAVTAHAAGDWQPLTTLVRLPAVTQISCPATPQLACKLSGERLFLIDAVAPDRAFTQLTQIPDGFPGNALPVPHPVDGRLFVRLRDAPASVIAATPTLVQLPPSADELSRAEARRAGDTGAAASAVQPAPPNSAAATITSAAPNPGAGAPSSQPTPPSPQSPSPAAVSPPASEAMPASAPAPSPAPVPAPAAEPAPASAAAAGATPPPR